MAFEFTRETIVPADPERVFDVSLNVDFHLDSFATTGEQIVGGVEGGVMNDGDSVTWRAKHFGIWWELTSTITDYERPSTFVDQQLKGPFAMFWHQHTFTPHDDGTLMMDHVRCKAPLGVLGLIAERLFLRRHITQLIEVRNTALVDYVARTAA